MAIKVNENSVLIFDLDDTLYNEIEFLKSAYKTIAATLEPDNWQFLYAEMFSLYRNKENVFQHLTERYAITSQELIDLYRRHEPNIKPFEGVIRLFETLKAQGVRTGIITDGRSTTQRNKIRALGVEDYIGKVVVSEEFGSEKPHPRNYKEMENFFGKGQYYYFADNFKKDFITPNKMGWITVGLLDNGLNIHSNCHLYTDKDYKPNILIDSIKEILEK